MGITVRQADLDADRDRLISSLREHLNPKTDTKRFSWFYEQNPQGPAKVWIAVDEDSGLLVGSSAALPRHFFVDGERRLGCVFMDSWVHPSYRFLGPAVRLQKACMDSVYRGEFAVGYDYPRQSMTAIYRRLRTPVTDELVTYRKVLRTDRFLLKRVRPAGLARALSAAANPLLALTDLRVSVPRGVEVESGLTRCDSEFDDLAARTAHLFAVQVARTAEYLNWRFHDHFHHHYEFIGARSEGRLVGFFVLLDDEAASQLNIVDFLVEPQARFWDALLATAVSLGRARRRSVLTVSMLSRDPRCSMLQAYRFSPSGTLPFVFLHATDMQLRPEGGALGAYGFSSGDEAD